MQAKGAETMPWVSYLPQAGADYARAFALHALVPEAQRLFYYSQGDNCTNFISQCVWAAYGGWLPDFSEAGTAQNRARIRADFRMTSGVWFGSFWHVGSPKWCRVEEFYAYVTAAKQAGPAATRIVDGTFETVSPSLLRVGDVVQLVVTPYTPDRFGHNLYVTQAGVSWDDVLICCQSYDRLDSPLTEFAAQPDIYPRLRVLRFRAAFFVK